MKRLFFYLLYYGFARHLPSSEAPGGSLWKAVRGAVCKNLFASCGKNVNIESGAFFHSGAQISLGENSGIGKNAHLSGKVTIGRDVMMGPHVTVWTRNHNFARIDQPMNQQGFGEEKPVVIGDDVWIGSHVIILPGVKINHGAVIGAGTVVAKEVPEWAVVAGNPAKILKFRLIREIVEV